MSEIRTSLYYVTYTYKKLIVLEIITNLRFLDSHRLLWLIEKRRFQICQKLKCIANVKFCIKWNISQKLIVSMTYIHKIYLEFVTESKKKQYTGFFI